MTTATPVWKAYGAGNKTAPASTSPRAAALAFFAKHPTARAAAVREFQDDGSGFVQRVFDMTGKRAPLRDFDNVTKKTAPSLPGDA